MNIDNVSFRLERKKKSFQFLEAAISTGLLFVISVSKKFTWGLISFSDAAPYAPPLFGRENIQFTIVSKCMKSVTVRLYCTVYVYIISYYEEELWELSWFSSFLVSQATPKWQQWHKMKKKYFRNLWFSCQVHHASKSHTLLLPP